MEHRLAANIELPFCNLYYLQEGEGPDIVWIPGGDQTGDVFSAQFAAFSPGYRNTSFDPRGVGRTTSKIPPPWPISDYAADCAALIRQVCEPPVILTGLSMGSLIVQEMALSYPELVRFAIPMGTGGRKSGFFREWEEAEIAFAAAGHSLPADFSVVHYAALTYPSDVLGDDALWQRCRPYVSSAYEARDPKMLAAQWQACVEYDALDRLPHCEVPIHVVAFSQDLQTPPSRGRVVAEAAKHGHFHLLEGLGHFSLFGHKPDVVNACIREIIDSYDLSSSGNRG
jgi:pimeloyl-ACP methyl ester carboxylesterase